MSYNKKLYSEIITLQHSELLQSFCLLKNSRNFMDTLCVPDENDFKWWKKDAKHD
jgi:hypothetical protein